MVRGVVALLALVGAGYAGMSWMGARAVEDELDRMIEEQQLTDVVTYDSVGYSPIFGSVTLRDLSVGASEGSAAPLVFSAIACDDLDEAEGGLPPNFSCSATGGEIVPSAFLAWLDPSGALSRNAPTDDEMIRFGVEVAHRYDPSAGTLHIEASSDIEGFMKTGIALDLVGVPPEVLRAIYEADADGSVARLAGAVAATGSAGAELALEGFQLTIADRGIREQTLEAMAEPGVSLDDTARRAADAFRGLAAMSMQQQRADSQLITGPAAFIEKGGTLIFSTRLERPVPLTTTGRSGQLQVIPGIDQPTEFARIFSMDVTHSP